MLHKRKYCTPAVGEIELEWETVLLGPSDTPDDYFEPLFVIEGHEIDGYYENEDIVSNWDE